MNNARMNKSAVSSFRAEMRRVVLFSTLVAAIALLQPALASAARPLETSVLQYPTAVFDGPERDLAFARVRGAGSPYVKLLLHWRSIAPDPRPAGFNADDPASPHYDWRSFDEKILLARAHGLRPIVMVLYAPRWAEGRGDSRFPGTARPDPSALAQFLRAAARRYNGNFQPDPYSDVLPAVRHWTIWNEPNLRLYVTPQAEGGRLVAPGWYRSMVNASSAAIRGVNAGNVIIAGGTAPFGGRLALTGNVGPLRFMRAMLCLTTRLRPKAGCPASNFDVWDHHPYTSGGPRHRAFARDDVSLGDLPEMRRVLRAAIRYGKIRSPRSIRFWVGEFGWDTRPPDPTGVPARTHARWVAEAMYRMWRVGVSHVTWLQLTDNPFPADRYQSGLYYRRAGGFAAHRAKPALRAFRFPFVALPSGRRVNVWGRTPCGPPWPSCGSPTRVIVQRRASGGWSRVRTLRTNRHGIFRASLRVPRGRTYRARLTSGTRAAALGFRAVPTRDRPGHPFGCGGGVPC
ncbi:MAG TPA: hypothetical protein VG079_01905 [Gaiellaceae bacterium]|nr:hypothetical protein [Gaiellaceae bacterium]